MKKKLSAVEHELERARAQLREEREAFAGQPLCGVFVKLYKLSWFDCGP